MERIPPVPGVPLELRPLPADKFGNDKNFGTTLLLLLHVASIDESVSIWIANTTPSGAWEEFASHAHDGFLLEFIS